MELRSRRRRVLGALLAVVGMSVGACSAEPVTAELPGLEAIADHCPKDALAQYVGVDVSLSSHDAVIAASRRTALLSITTRAAVCKSHLHVVAFAASAAGSAVLFDDVLAPGGATEIAQLRKVPELVDETMATIDAGLDAATQTVGADGGSDVTAEFGLAAEYVAQLSSTGSFQLDLDLLTDGVQTVGVVLNTADLTVPVATDLAARATVVPLPATSVVTISGLGKTAGSPPPTEFTDALKAFFLTYCGRTGAASCAAVTDYTDGS